MSRAFWTSAFLDLAPGDLDRGTRFWSSVTGYDATAVADVAREFPPLEPPTGASYLWVQRVGDAPSRVHVDLHVPDLDAAVEQAWQLRAEVVDRRDHVVLRSPGGLPFRLVSDPASSSALFHSFTPFSPVALDLVVTPCDDSAAYALLEVGTADRDRERARHELLGARVVGSGATHDELVDPVGIRYRIGDRNHRQKGYA